MGRPIEGDETPSSLGKINGKVGGQVSDHQGAEQMTDEVRDRMRESVGGEIDPRGVLSGLPASAVYVGRASFRMMTDDDWAGRREHTAQPVLLNASRETQPTSSIEVDLSLLAADATAALARREANAVDTTGSDLVPEIQEGIRPSEAIDIVGPPEAGLVVARRGQRVAIGVAVVSTIAAVVVAGVVLLSGKPGTSASPSSTSASASAVATNASAHEPASAPATGTDPANTASPAASPAPSTTGGTAVVAPAAVAVAPPSPLGAVAVQPSVVPSSASEAPVAEATGTSNRTRSKDLAQRARRPATVAARARTIASGHGARGDGKRAMRPHRSRHRTTARRS